MKVEIISKTLVPVTKGQYNAFPTMVTHRSNLVICYRRGISTPKSAHGVEGQVRKIEMPLDALQDAFKPNGPKDLTQLGRDDLVFAGKDNEFDAIVSNPRPQIYTLATRNYNAARQMKTFISWSDSPQFKDRQHLQIKSIGWFCFYGKAFNWDQGMIFPAYGTLRGESDARPLLLITDDFKHWDVLSYLPAYGDGEILNESSIVKTEQGYTIFTRQDTGKFGLWYAESSDLQHWSAPKRLRFAAQAPMAIEWNGKRSVAFRNIKGESKAALSLWQPFEEKYPIDIENYSGNIYDGGYCDLALLNGLLYVSYYLGNDAREPCLRLARLKKTGNS